MAPLRSSPTGGYRAVRMWRVRRGPTPRSLGNRTTPSMVAFPQDDSPILVGDAARSQMNMNPVNTVFDVKRLIGRRFISPARAGVVHGRMCMTCRQLRRAASRTRTSKAT
jgi:molecular chaperone DnaK (HSP70)